MAKQKHLSNQELVNALAGLFNEIKLETEEVDEVLLEAGYCPDKIGEQMKTVAEQTIANYQIEEIHE